MRLWFLLIMLGLAACVENPPRDPSTFNRIKDEMKQAGQTKATGNPPESISRALLPPLKIALPKTSAKQLEQHFDLMVSAAPANQVFMGIVSGTRYSMLVHPEVKGAISVNLKDVTVFEALDAIREMYGYEYKVDGGRIYILKPGLQAKVYKVNYITGTRRGMSDLRVTSGAGASSSSSGGSNSSSGSSTQTQASALVSGSKSDFWGEIEDAMRTVLGCKIPNQSGTQNTAAAAASSGGSTANRSLNIPGESNTGERERGIGGCSDGRSVVINQMSSTILVRGMPDELRTIEAMLRTMQVNIERQVILEAKIIDVELNADSQQGINWAGFQRGKHRISVGADTTSISEPGNNGGTTTGSTLGGILGTGLLSAATGGAFSAGLGIALQLRNFSAMMDFLKTQGEVHVLSSPRISTINNQKAVLKVGRDEQFVTGFESSASSTTTTGGTVVSTPTPIYSTYFSGISLDVTPQIDEADNITLHVHPLVSDVTEVMKQTINNQTLPFASNKISETDSVVKVSDGQIVVIGGLMTESYQDARSKVPGAGEAPGVGVAFRKGGQSSTKRELVILLKPTIVRGDAWTDDIAATQRRIESLGAEAAPTGKR